MGSSSMIRWMVFHIMAHAPLTWASEINCYFNGEVIGSHRHISLARNVEKHHRFWGARALGSWQSIQIACRLQESVREDTGRRVIHVVRRKLTARSHVLVSWSVYPNYEYHYCRDLEASQHVIGLDCGLLVGHNAVWSPNFYMLCSDLLSVVNRKFGISYGWFPV